MSDYTTQGSRGKAHSVSFQHIRYMTVTALLSTIAFVLQFFEFPIPLIPPFIKMDFSDLPELIGAFAMGPMSGVLIALIKNLLKTVLATHSFGIGELCNFFLGAVFALSAGLIYKFNKTKRGAVIGALVGAIVMAAASFPINYFIIYPFYELMMPRETIIAAYQAIMPSVTTLAQCLLVFNVPFTLFKALCSVGITMLVYKKISPLLHGE